MRIVFGLLLAALLLGGGCNPAATPAPAPNETAVPNATTTPVVTPAPAPDEMATPAVYTNVVYAEIAGADAELTSLDIYTPGGTARPVMVFIHGGGWQIGDKGNGGEKPAAFNEAGYVYVTVNYRLSPEVRHPVHVSDVAAAIAWVYENIDDYGGDPERIFIMGHSAGAHLAALVATDEKYLQAHGYSLEILRGVTLLDGAGYDLPAVYQLNRALWAEIYEIPFGDDPAVRVDASPINHIAPDKDIPPFFIIYVADRDLSRLISGQLADALRNAGGRAEIAAAGNKTHATLNRELGEPGDEITKLVFEFLDGLEK